LTARALAELLGGGDGGTVSLDVVRVPVPAVLVIGDKDLGLVEPYQRRYAVVTSASGTLQNAPGSRLASQPAIPESW